MKMLHVGMDTFDRQKRLDKVIERAITEDRIVGTVVLVAENGELIYRRSAGFSDCEKRKLIEENALFRLSSVTKPIVSAAALALVSQGKMSLEDDIKKWLPEFRPRLANGQEAFITIRHLLTHTTGLTYGFLEEQGGAYHRAGVSDGMDRSGLSLEENLKRLSTVSLLYTPGTNWGYSIATDVLGAIISKVSNSPLEKAVQSLVTKPLNMKDTAFHVVDEKRLVTPYVNDRLGTRRMGKIEIAQVFEGTAGIRFEPDRVFDKDAFPSGGSGMVGSASDFLQFLEELRVGKQLLSSELSSEMRRVQTGDIELENWPGRGFGLGFTILKDPKKANTKESIGSWRLGGAYGHSWFVDPIKKLSVVAFTNTAFEGMSGQFTIDICNAVYG
ncbi:serine hydrolase domain-containing protein [Bacillus sp. C1]